MATVTSFAEFLAAIQGNEDIVLANDIDANAEGYEYVDALRLKSTLDGQGHTIANVTVNGTEGISRIGNYASLKNVYFRDFALSATNDAILFSGISDMTNCQISALFNTKNTAYAYRITQDCSIEQCGFDITIGNASYVMGTDLIRSIIQKCNIVIRNVPIISSGGQTIMTQLTNSAVVFDNCVFDSRGIALYGAGSYVAFHDCTCNDNMMSVYGDRGNYFCNDSEISCDVTNMVELTPEQLKSREYLQSIGFLP